MVSDGRMPPVWVVEAFEVWSKTPERAWSRLAKLVRIRSSVSRVAKNDSATALSYASPLRPIDIAMPAWRHRVPNAVDVYCPGSRGRCNTALLEGV